MTEDELHWRTEPEWVPCVLCGGERRYMSTQPPRRRLWGKQKPADDRCPHCGAR